MGSTYTQDPLSSNLNQHDHQQHGIHRKGRDSGYGVDSHHNNATTAVPASGAEEESTLRKVINKLNPLHRSPSPSPVRSHGAVMGSTAGVSGGPVTHGTHSGSDRPPGVSSTNPNIPGEDNRTLTEKARDKLDPRRHSPDDHTRAHVGTAGAVGHGVHHNTNTSSNRPPGVSSTNPNIPGEDNRTLTEKARDKLDPRRHSPDDHTRGHVGTAGAIGTAGTAGHGVHHHNVTNTTSSNRPAGMSSTNPNIPGEDNRTLGEKARDTLNPRRHSPDRHGHGTVGTAGAIGTAGVAAHGVHNTHHTNTDTTNRPAGLSSTHPNIPGEDNRTFGEKARDTLDPRRHSPDQHNRANVGLGHGADAHNTTGTSTTSSNRPAGMSSTNPNVPGEDNRTLTEKARDKLDPRRHSPDDHTRGHVGTVGTAGAVGQGTHHQHHSNTVGHEHDHNGHVKQAALGMAAVTGADAAHRHHEDKKDERAQGHHLRHDANAPYGTSQVGYDDRTTMEKVKDKMDPRVDSTTAVYGSPNAAGYDDRSTLEKVKDKVDPRVKSDRREAQVVAGNRGGVGNIEHSLRETRLDNDNPSHLRDERSVPYAADSTDTLGRLHTGFAQNTGTSTAGHHHQQHHYGADALAAGTGAGLAAEHHHHHHHQPTQTGGLTSHQTQTGASSYPSQTGGLSSHQTQAGGISSHPTQIGTTYPSHQTQDSSRFADATSGNRSAATGGLHIGGSTNPAGQSSPYRPDVEGENYQPGYTIPPAERTGDHLGSTKLGQQQDQQRRDTEIPVVHATGVRAEGGNFDAANPGAGSEARRLLDQAEQTGSTLDPSMR